MAGTSAKRSIKEHLAEAANQRSVASVASVAASTQAANDEKFANIAANPFHQIFANKETKPSEKQAAIAALTIATDDKEHNRQAIAAYEEFSAWMQEKRQTWAVEMMDLLDTTTTSIVKKFYLNMGSGTLEFNESLKDLTDLLEGLDELRVQGRTQEVFEILQKENAEKERRAKIRAEQEQKTDELLADKEKAQRRIATLKQDKGLFGGIKKSSRVAIEQTGIDIKNIDAKISGVANDRAKTEAEFAAQPSIDLGEKLEFAKSKLDELLKMSDDAHNARQKRLVDSGKNYVIHTREDTALALEHLTALGDQYQKMQDKAKNMRSSVLIVNEGMKDATTASRDLYQSLNPPADADAEGEIARMEREDKQAVIRDHVTTLELTAGERVSTLADLTQLTSQANTMRENNEQEVQRVRTMNQNGVSGTAERLVTVMTRINSAMLHQGAAMTQDALNAMNTSTHELMTNGILAHGVGMLEDNDQLAKAIEELKTMSEKTQQATNVRAEALSEGAKIRADNEAYIAQFKQDQENYLKQAAVMKANIAEQTPSQSATVKPAVKAKAPSADLF